MLKIYHKFKQMWSQYRYRFVPWIALNLNRSAKTVDKGYSDKLIPDEAVQGSLVKLFSKFHQFYHPGQRVCLERAYRALTDRDPAHIASHNLQATKDQFGFTVEKGPSTLPHGGMGVFVTSGLVPQGTIVCFYPGTVYYPHEAILFQSIGNTFIFRCIDGVLIDGNDRSLSRMIFKSCSQRDRQGPFDTCDWSWMTNYPQNPLAIGQYVNNHNKEFPSNVAYQEYDVPVDFPFHLKQFIPNVFYSSHITEDHMSLERTLRMVVLVSVREIKAGEELFSSYFTVIH
ncbi:SET domain-containing protein 9-like [Saccostrea echinata]|uniref:SET domain-containing protein 9-like n=1 Tax=Saccostrea echinata TaxID=191078 RepID=UPI002A81C749|nr:SET domain-containing protein 9-like [Saccostrea echinata]